MREGACNKGQKTEKETMMFITDLRFSLQFKNQFNISAIRKYSMFTNESRT